MRRINPLLTETALGLGRAGQIHWDALNYLLAQTAVLFLAWPKTPIGGRLDAETGPATLLAVLVAVGLSVAYYSLRAGAEEALLPGQHPLRDWCVATPLTPGCILRGYLGGHLLQTLHVVALSSPLLLLGFVVSAGRWSDLGWSVAAALAQATFYRLLGAVMALTFAGRERLVAFALRAALALGYLGAATLLPVASHWHLSARLLDGGAWRHATDFLLVYTGLCALLAGVLYRLLARQQPTRPP